MATTTPNYGWPVPTSTDLVKDGATAIEALGDAIDATVFGLPGSGMVLVKSQVIGTAVSSVTVTSAFSTTYDAYKIIVTGGVSSATATIELKLGATVTGYYAGYVNSIYSTAAVSGQADNNASAFRIAGYTTSSVIALNVNLQNPFLAKNTIFNSLTGQSTTGAGGSTGNGYLANTTSYTDFTLTPGSGTLTGGTIRIYGYNN